MEQHTNPPVIDLSTELAAIKRQFGERYYVEPAAHQEAARLWGARCNDCGVVTDVTERIEVTHDGFRGEVRLCQTAKGYWLIGMSLTTPLSGFGIPASVWDRFGFIGRNAARRWALDYLIQRLTFSDAGNSRQGAKVKFLQRLEDAKTPQLELF